MEEKNYCRECGTENDVDALYCRNCGHTLETKQASASANDGRFTYNNYYTAPTPENISESFKENLGIDNIDGIPIEDVTAFVGKNGDKIIPRWSDMQKTNKKASFCVPVFLLTLFFGLFGSAMWFCYRKMYKIGACLLALALAVNIATTFFITPFAQDYLEDYTRVLEEYFVNGESQTDSAEYLLDDTFSNPNTLIALLASSVKNIAKIALSLIFGFYGLYIYKKQMIKKLLKFPQRLNSLELSIVGGTSGGAVALSAVLYLVAFYTVQIAIMIGVRLF